MKKSILFVVAMFMAFTTYSQQSARDYQTKIEELNKEMAQSMIEGNIEKNLSMYTDDAISLPDNEPMRDGIAAIRQGAEEMAKAGVKVSSFEPTVKKIIPEGNLITEIGSFKIKVNIPGMDRPVEQQGKYLTIWEKQADGSLKVKVETWNTDENPMNQMNQMNNQEQK